MCMSISLACMSVDHYLCSAHGHQKGIRPLGMESDDCELGTKPESSASTASVLKRWVISPASSLPNHILYFCVYHSPYLIWLSLCYTTIIHTTAVLSFESLLSLTFFSFLFVFCSIQWFSLRGDWWWKQCIMKRCHHFIFVSVSPISKCG